MGSQHRRESQGTLLPGLTQHRIFIDDERLLGQTIRLGLKDTVDVEVEVLGQAGLARILGAEKFAVILCDLSLPDQSGMEIYAEISRQRPELRPSFVIMTGGAVTESSQRFLENYPGSLLPKPFTLSQVEALVLSLIEERAVD